MKSSRHGLLMNRVWVRNWLPFKDKGKGKGHPITGNEGPEREQTCSSTLPSTPALDGVGSKRHAPAALPPGKTWYPLHKRLGGPQGRSGRVREMSLPPGFDPRTVQTVASRYPRPGCHVSRTIYK